MNIVTARPGHRGHAPNTPAASCCAAPAGFAPTQSTACTNPDNPAATAPPPAKSPNTAGSPCDQTNNNADSELATNRNPQPGHQQPGPKFMTTGGAKSLDETHAWLAYYQRSASVYEQIAKIDPGHEAEALYWARRERARADNITARIKARPGE